MEAQPAPPLQPTAAAAAPLPAAAAAAAGGPQHGLRFRRYASIENHQLEADALRSAGLDGGEWVVMEKVHGSNFCFLTDGTTVSAARRQALLTPGDKYYPGWEILLDMYGAKVLHAFQLLREHYALHPPPPRYRRTADETSTPEAEAEESSKAEAEAEETKAPGREQLLPKELYVYGELFGGMYPGLPTPATQAHVQKGIYYSPTYDFFAFDLHDGQRYVDYDVAEEIFKKAGFFYAEALFRGPFEACLAFPHEFPTTLPARRGLPPLAGAARYAEYKNLAEGTVLKPVRNAYTAKGARVILKKKIDLFAEIIDVRKPDPAKKDRNAKLGSDARLQQEMARLAASGGDPAEAEAVQWLCEELARYVNPNRLTAVVSKIGAEAEVRRSHLRKRGLLIGLLAQDALEDLLKRPEARERFDRLSKDRRHVVTRRLNTLASDPVALFFSSDGLPSPQQPSTAE